MSGSSYGHYPCDRCQVNIVATAATTLPFCPAATYPPGHFVCANPLPVSFSRKETGAQTTAAAQIERGFAAILLVTIDVANAEVTSNSDADDGAADHGMDCTWLTARHAPVIAWLPSPDSGSRGAGFVSQCSLHPPTGNGAQGARS